MPDWRSFRISSMTIGLLGMSSKVRRSRGAKIGWWKRWSSRAGFALHKSASLLPALHKFPCVCRRRASGGSTGGKRAGAPAAPRSACPESLPLWLGYSRRAPAPPLPPHSHHPSPGHRPELAKQIHGAIAIELVRRISLAIHPRREASRPPSAIRAARAETAAAGSIPG